LQFFPLCVARRVGGTASSGGQRCDPRDRVKPPVPCGDCAVEPACPGTFRLYLEAFGSAELEPVRNQDELA
jgi:hypothetical protein